ncbi:hypothetical protein R50073_40850 [Maricurvus nonylphenolicus]
MGGSEGKITPRTRVDHREETILRAVSTLVDKQSFWDTSTRQIAAEAGVSEGTIYHYFKNKTLLLEAVVEKNYSELAQRIAEKLIGESSFSSQLLTFLELSLVEFSNSNGLFVHFISAYWVAREPEYDGFWSTLETRLAKDYVNLSKRILEQGLAAGELKAEVDIEELNYILMGCLERSTFYLIDGGNPATSARDVVREILDFLAPLMMADSEKLTVDYGEMEAICQRLESGLFRIKSLGRV